MKGFYINCVLLLGMALLQNSARGQAYIDFSKYEGSNITDGALKIQVVNGEVYKAGYRYSPSASIVTKYNANGTVVYSTDLGSVFFGYGCGMKVINGEVFLLGWSFFTINVAKLKADGSIAFIKFFGGGEQISPIYSDIQIVGNEWLIAGNTGGNNYPVTMGSPGYDLRNGFITKISTIDGSIIMSMFTGGSDENYTNDMCVENGAIYIVGSSSSVDLPLTIGNYVNDGLNHIYVRKLDWSNFNTIYCRYVGNTSSSVATAAKVVNGELHFTGTCYSSDYPVTNGTTASGTTADQSDGIYTRLNTNGSIGFSTFLSTDDYYDDLSWLNVSNGVVYLAGRSTSSTQPYYSILIYKINNTGSIGYSKKIHFDRSSGIYPSFGVLNGDFFISGAGVNVDYPVTNGTQYYNDSTGFFTHFGPSGEVIFSTFLGKMNTMLPMQIVNNKIYLSGSTDIADYPTTNGSIAGGNEDNILFVYKPDGTSVFSGYIGGSDNEGPVDIAIENSNIYLCGNTRSVNFPVTDNILYQGNQDQFLTKLSFCSNKYNQVIDTLLPKTQTVCKYGFGELIIGKEMIVPSDSLPTIYYNGIPAQQNPLGGSTYQWQVAYSTAGPWIDIAGAILKDYRPVVGSVNQYYRRLSFTSPDCGTAFIHTSDTASAIVTTLTSPTIDAGGPFHTCPGSAIIIGGSPTVTGGNPPYMSYVWDMGAAAVPNPSVAPLVNTIYTLIVTDALGCKQIGQAVVLDHRADAGPDKNNCGGTAVKIGIASIVDLPGIIYDWQPGTTLSSSSIAQPFANPAIPTEYELILTVPKSGGGTCITKDTVKVAPIAAPITPNMAGPDKVICLGDSALLGTGAEAGFNYYWSPANYLINDNHSIITYYPNPTTDMPTPNPATITLTAQKQGCSFTDQIVVATIESRAGPSYICGPRIVGLPDRTPNINETYSWGKISGPGNFTGVTNLPQVPVSASVGGSTIYGLTVSYNGESCYSEVSVPECGSGGSGSGGGCMVAIDTIAKYHCPGYAANNGDVTLIASSNIVNAVYTWSPQAGLSAYTGSTVHLTDNVPRTYTVTVTDANDPSIHCTDQIFVNNPLFAAPVFPAPDIAICASVPVSIGLPTVTGYTYEWTGSGLSNYFISNPVATVASQTQYKIKVRNGTGCELNDTVIVFVQSIPVDAGPDWVICSNGVARLGTAAQPNASYLWEPQSSPWQNGTNQFSAQPEVLIATNVTFTVTATTSAGCVTTDQVNIVVNNSPTIPDAPDKVICLGYNVFIGSPALPGVSYQWSPTTGLNNATIAQPQAHPTSTTTYTVLATFQGSCVLPATDQVTVTVSNPAFDLPDINFCPSNGPFQLGVGAPIGMSEYFWFPTQMVTNHLIANPSTLNPPPNVPTTFNLRVRNSNNCYYYDTINVIPSIVAPVAGTDRTICKNETLVIGSPANTTGPGITYNWSPVTNLSDPTNPNPVFTATSSGVFTYILTKTDNNVSCSSKDTIAITVQELVLPQLNTATVCQNSCVQIGTTAVTGIQYQWAPAAGLSNTTISNPIACVGTVAASYTLTATNQDGCIATGNVVVGVNSLPAPQITIPTVTACLGDNNTTFNPLITPAGSYSYLWSPDNGTLSNIYSLNPGIILTGIGNTQYTLEVTDDVTGCSSTAIGNLFVNNCPVLATTGNFMWFDANENGLQDPVESGVSGVNVKLYNDVGFNLSSTVTNANGIYYFGDIPPGNNYYAVFSKPAGYLFTMQNVGGNGANNNSKPDATGRTNNFNIASGANITNIDAGIKTDPVPITLLSFTAVLHNREVFLNWQTTAEYNNQYFDVQRSNDGIHFISIGSVNGNGTTSLPHDYTLTDQHPITGINYYRLKQVDFDARYTYSYIVAVQLNNPEIVSVYYNNQSNTIEISFNKKQDNVQLALYGANGQLLKYSTAEKNINTYSFKLPVLATGIYMLRVMNDKLAFTKKLYINKK